MFQSIIGYFSPPVFPNEENKTRIAGYVHWIALAFMSAILAFVVFSKLFTGSFSLNIFDGVLLFILAII
jgi:hypothetical protein